MSASSEIVDSGRSSGKITPAKPPVKSSFSQTCNLFSQYLKENSNFPDLTLGGKSTASTTTMNLFPMAGETRRTNFQQQSQNHHDQSRSMTIFYNGQVMVFNDLSPEKVKEIMKLAEKGVSQTPPKPDESVMKKKNSVLQPAVVSGSDLPIARKASLARFLDKRKDRITARSPYQVQEVSNQDDSKTWLGLGAQSHVEFQPRS